MSLLIKQIGLNIKKYRKEAGIKQYELAKKVGINNITLSKIERGCEAVKVSTIERIGILLGYSFEQMVFGRDSIILNNAIIEKLKE